MLVREKVVLDWLYLAACVALRAQQLRSCVMIVSPSRLLVCALAGALVLAAVRACASGGVGVGGV